MIGGNDANITAKAFSLGWLVNDNITPIQQLAESYQEDFNKALAKAYRRYNYHEWKFQKKTWINNPIGMSLLQFDGTKGTLAPNNVFA